jgi:hypothetical protein
MVRWAISACLGVAKGIFSVLRVSSELWSRRDGKTGRTEYARAQQWPEARRTCCYGVGEGGKYVVSESWEIG